MYKRQHWVIPNVISGMVSSVDCLKNITDQFGKDCDFCFSLIQTAETSLSSTYGFGTIWIQSNCYHFSEKHTQKNYKFIHSFFVIQILGHCLSLQCDCWAKGEVTANSVEWYSSHQWLSQPQTGVNHFVYGDAAKMHEAPKKCNIYAKFCNEWPLMRSFPSTLAFLCLHLHAPQ